MSGLTFITSGQLLSGVIPIFGVLSTGPTSGSSYDEYTGASGPTSFGSGFTTLASSGSGDRVGIDGINGGVFVPFGYVSGTALSDSMTFNNATFASLGVTRGTYVWTWGLERTRSSFCRSDRLRCPIRRWVCLLSHWSSYCCSPPSNAKCVVAALRPSRKFSTARFGA